MNRSESYVISQSSSRRSFVSLLLSKASMDVCSPMAFLVGTTWSLPNSSIRIRSSRDRWSSKQDFNEAVSKRVEACMMLEVCANNLSAQVQQPNRWYVVR